jgi:hypothetical protein
VDEPDWEDDMIACEVINDPEDAITFNFQDPVVK